MQGDTETPTEKCILIFKLNQVCVGPWINLENDKHNSRHILFQKNNRIVKWKREK